MPDAAVNADLTNGGKNDVFRRNACLQFTRNFDEQRPGAALQQALRREDMGNLGRPDAKGERAKSTVRAGVAVAANNGLAR